MNGLVFLVLAAAVAVANSAPGLLPSSSPVPILREAHDGPNPDGSYSFSFETGDGIAVQEQGNLKSVDPENAAVVAQGDYSYTAPDGTPIQVRYVADENGFQPQGAHIPVAPAIPEGIQRALEFIATHPYNEEEELKKHRN